MATSAASRLLSALVLLFCLMYACGVAVEEGPELEPRGAADRWCYANAYVNFNTWQLLINLANAIAHGETTLINAEKAKVELDTRIRLRRAVADA
jgi:hypothetical protein